MAQAKAAPFFILAVFSILTVLAVAIAQQPQELRQQAAPNPQLVSPDDIDKYFQCLTLGGECDEQVAKSLKAVDPAECVTLKEGQRDPDAILREYGEIIFAPKVVSLGETLRATGTFIIDEDIPECSGSTHAKLPSYTILAIHEETGERMLFSDKTVPFTLVAHAMKTEKIRNVGENLIRLIPEAYAEEDQQKLDLEITISGEVPKGTWIAFLIVTPDGNVPAEEVSTDDAIATGEFTVQEPCLADAKAVFTLNGQSNTISVSPGDTINFNILFTAECSPPEETELSIMLTDSKGAVIDYPEGVNENMKIPGSFSASYTIPETAPAGKWEAGISLESSEIENLPVIPFTVSRKEPAVCTQTPTDYQGGCAEGLICNTFFDKECPGLNCTGWCLEFEDQICVDPSKNNQLTVKETPGAVCKPISKDEVRAKLGKPCETHPNRAGFDGFYGNCYSGKESPGVNPDDAFTKYALICYTVTDNSPACKNTGDCKGHCRAAWPGDLPGEPCKKLSPDDWQGGCINGQYCSKNNLCKPGGKAEADREAAGQPNEETVSCAKFQHPEMKNICDKIVNTGACKNSTDERAFNECIMTSKVQIVPPLEIFPIEICQYLAEKNSTPYSPACATIINQQFCLDTKTDQELTQCIEEH